MKVLIISNLYYPNIVGGAEKVAQNLAEGLVARGQETVVATLNPQRRFDVVRINDVRVYYLPVKNLYSWLDHKRHSKAVKAFWHALDSYNPSMATSLGGILDAERPDLVNTHNLAGFSPSVWHAVKKRRLPLVHTAHDYYVLCPRSTMHRNGKNCPEPCPDCRMYSRPRKRLSEFVDVATAPSRFILDRHLRHGVFPTAERVPIYNCCERPPQGQMLRDGADRPFRFGFLGRLHPAKGIEVLVRSFSGLPPGQAELLIAGRGASDYERQLRGMTDGHPGVRWLGFVSPGTLFNEVDVLVVPSRWHDPAPLVVLESLAHLVPLIGSCRGGIPELMGEGTGWIFDPDDPNALTQALQNAIESRGELAAMRERAGEQARQFSAEVMINRYLQAFSHAIDKAAQRR